MPKQPSYQTTMKQPNPLVIGKNRWWKLGTKIPGFQAGQGRMNASDKKFKQKAGYNEIHATIETFTKNDNMGNELRDYIRKNDKNYPKRGKEVGDRVDLGKWETKYQRISSFHLSLYDSAGNKMGGWYSPSASSVGAFTANGGRYAPNPAEERAAKAIIGNMANLL